MGEGRNFIFLGIIMKIKFNKKYKSINDFTESEIQDFSVFLGINGSGKTHLLKAMQEGAVFADSITKERVSYFNLQNFLIKTQKKVSPRTIDEEKQEAWNILQSHKQQCKHWDSIIKKNFEGKKYPYDIDIVDENKKQQYTNLRRQFLNLINNQTKNSPKIGKLLKTGLFESGKYASEITQEEFFKYANYNPDDYELLESLSELFLDYQKKLTIAKLPTRDGGESLDDEEIQKRQEQSPWNFVNTMFKELGIVHTIAFPKFTAGDLIQSQALAFQVKLFTDNEEIDFDDLSSGEKILCALAITVYQDNKSKFPELLLLDEVDASLHPSMIQYLLDVIENVFIKNGCKVILATHSPTTVALASEDSLFEIQKGRDVQKIRKISKKDAVNLLGEGFITLDKAMKIWEEVFNKNLTVISEGKNYEHIKKLLELSDNELIKKITLYKHDSGSGDSDLCGLFEFFKNTKFDKKILFVWDCDSVNKVKNKSETENVFKFCFKKNEANKICFKGIENLYPENIFTNDLLKIVNITQNGKTETKKEFPENNKNRFLEKIKQQTDNTIFANFQPLIDKIKELLTPSI